MDRYSCLDRHFLPISLIENHNEKTNSQYARRLPGLLLGNGSFSAGASPVECRVEGGSQDHKEIASAVEYLSEGLQYLQAYQNNPGVRHTLKAAQSAEKNRNRLDAKS